MRHTAPILLLAIAACTAPLPNQGSWAGDVTPQPPGPACLKTRGIAQISGDRATFIPNEGTWMLVGTLLPDGTLTAEKSQLGANKQPYETHLEARIAGDRLTGTYTTPRCTFAVTMTRR